MFQRIVLWPRDFGDLEGHCQPAGGVHYADDEEVGEIPVAFVVCQDPAPSQEEIQAYVGSQLSHYKQLHRVTFVETIPKSPSGKILRRLLRDGHGNETAPRSQAR